jgi:hypothetical protein
LEFLCPKWIKEVIVKNLESRGVANKMSKPRIFDLYSFDLLENLNNESQNYKNHGKDYSKH